MREHDGEPAVAADRADIAEMICQPLQLRHQGAQPVGARGRRPVERSLHRARKRNTVSDRRIAGATACQLRSALNVGAPQKTLDSLVRVAEALLEAHHRVAVGADPEVARFDDGGMDGAYGKLVNALSFDGKEAVFAGLAMRMRPRWQWAMVCPISHDRARDAYPANRPATTETDRRRRVPAGSRAHGLARPKGSGPPGRRDSIPRSGSHRRRRRAPYARP